MYSLQNLGVLQHPLTPPDLDNLGPSMIIAIANQPVSNYIAIIIIMYNIMHGAVVFQGVLE